MEQFPERGINVGIGDVVAWIALIASVAALVFVVLS